MLEVLRPSASLILVSLLGDFIHSHGFISHMPSDDSQFLSPVLISPLKSGLVSQLSQRYPPRNQQAQGWTHLSSLPGAVLVQGLSMNDTNVCLVAQAEAKGLFSPITILFIIKSYKISPSKSLKSICFSPSPLPSLVQVSRVSLLNDCSRLLTVCPLPHWPPYIVIFHPVTGFIAALVYFYFSKINLVISSLCWNPGT